MLRLRYLKFISASCPTHCSKRNVAAMKRFYRNTGILSSNENEYEITLDQRKLKTPLGKVFKVKSKPLALAVAHEWDSQKKTINRSLMHLTALSSTVLDNPNKLTQDDIVKYIVDYLETDTLLFQSNQADENVSKIFIHLIQIIITKIYINIKFFICYAHHRIQMNCTNCKRKNGIRLSNGSVIDTESTLSRQRV